MKKRIAFIVNPISGGIKKDRFPAMVSKHINPEIFFHEIFYTTSTENNKELARKCVAEKYDAVIAVGGDGTINNTAKYVTGSESLFGIIPMGSGNGLARHLGISMDHKQALEIINKMDYTYMDTGLANHEFFLNVAGVGFDAHVSWMFANAPKRGFWSYARIIMKEFSAYKTDPFELIIDGVSHTEDAFLIAVANGSQYGNNAYIAPLAKVNDGIFEVTVLKPFGIAEMPGLGLRMFNKTMHKSKKVKLYAGSHVVIRRSGKEVANIDGEPVMMPEELDIKLIPASLKVIIP